VPAACDEHDESGDRDGPVPPTPLAAQKGVAVGRSSRWEEDHVVVVTQRHELQAPEPDHRTERKWSYHLNSQGMVIVTRKRPLPGVPTVGVRNGGSSTNE
jgi:hypothetical protein